ncbi:NUDIX hydrolase [Poriferisphaera sp. WC338]|uniref:NUDIX hydrolase n=1 Tax=Poriferisphaera sp. WC338 TaxID=3425129 RepID=UPI003D81BEAB
MTAGIGFHLRCDYNLLMAESSEKSPTRNRPQHNGRVHGVVVAIYRAEDRKWLMIRRSENVAAPLSVCFPGGAREHGETHEQTAHREMQEELGLTVHLLQQVWHHEVDDRPLTLFGYLAILDPAQQMITPDPYEIAEPLWLTTEEALAQPDAIPNSAYFIEKLTIALPKHGF